jgi:hypothetical protein
VAILFAILYLFTNFLSPMKSYAHDTFFLQVLIDEGTKQYQGNVVEDGVDSEAKHIENSLGNFKEIFKDEAHLYPQVSDNKKDFKKTEFGEEIAVFSFTPNEQGEAWGGKRKNDATKADIDRAYNIRDNLVPGLNDALFILNGNRQFDSTKEMMAMAKKLTSVGVDAGAKTIEGYDKNGNKANYTIQYKKRGYPEEKLSDFRRNTLGVSDSDFVKITSPNKEVFEFIYRMPKGYSSLTKNANVKWDNRVYDKEYDYKGDAKYITWHMLIYQGNYAMFTNGWTMTKANEIKDTNKVEEFFVGMIQSMLNGLRNLLGLYSLNELVYNDGIRGSSAWVFGTMPITWHDNVVKYHMVFQALAWALISFAIVKSLIQRNLATINPSMRVSLIEQIQNLLITGFILASIFPIISMFMYLNVKIVDLFGSLAPDFGDFTGLNNYSNWLAGMILQCFYFVVTLYLNFVYIMRSITLAILIAMAPLFVVTIAFGGQWKQLFGVWMRELLANLFLQSFHAFILAFFVTTTASSRGIESMVLAFAMIPLTEFFRSMVMGQGGGMAHSLGVGATSAAAGIAMKTIGAGAKGAKNMAGSKSGNNGDADGQAVDMMNNNRSNSQDMAKTQQQPIKGVKQGGGALDTKRANDNQEIPLDVFTKGTAEQKAMFKGDEISGTKAGFKDALSALKPNSASSAMTGAGKALVGGGIGVLQAGLGAGVMLAMGGSSGVAMQQGLNMMEDGAGKVKNSLAPSVGAVGQAISSVKEGIAMDKKPQYKTPVDETGQIRDFKGMEPVGSTHRRVHRDGNMMHEQAGIVTANMSGNNAIYQYDSSRLSQNDNANLEHYKDVFANGSQADKEHLISNGIQNVTARNDDGFNVTYNRVGMEQMGIESVYTVGSGDRKSIVETKRNDQPIPTYNTVNVQQSTPRQSPILDGSGNPYQVPKRPVPNMNESRPTPHPVQPPQPPQTGGQPQPQQPQQPRIFNP